MQTAPQIPTVLIVEDNDDDFEAVESAVRSASDMGCVIERCASGQAALELLESRASRIATRREARPLLILLDLNLPGLSGLEVLTRIKTDTRWQTIPVIVMTSSTDPRDVDTCYRAGANAYVQKPMDLPLLFLAVSRLERFWLETAILPS